MGTQTIHTTTRRSLSAHGRQHGQVLPLALAGVVLGFSIFVMLVNTGNRVTEKSRVANIADATALSGATVLAQHLNTMAYLNRAAAANHVGAGHMVAWVSWSRYVQEVMERLDDVGQFIPYVNTVTRYLELAAEYNEYAAELAAHVYMPAVDKLNKLYFTAQQEQFVMLQANVPLAMRKVANASHDKVKINESALTDFPVEESGLLASGLAFQAFRLLNFASSYGMLENNREGERFSRNTWGNTSDRNRGSMSIPWMTDRNWEVRFPRVKKQGGIKHVRGNGCFNWDASDKLKVKPALSTSWLTLAEGEASAREFYSSYCGMHGVASLKNTSASHQVLSLMALTSISQSDIYARNTFELEQTAGAGGVTGMAIAQVEFVRPKSGFNAIRDDEYANLYNPFWQARLVGSSMKDVPKMFETVSKWRDSL